MSTLLLLSIIAPLFAAILGYTFRRGGNRMAVAGAVISAFSALALAIFLPEKAMLEIYFSGLAGKEFLLKADLNSAIVSAVVGIVGLAIFIYALGYMYKKKGQTWFWPAISLFLAAMQLLVLAGDWFLFITGWEIMGLASYLLIATWHEKEEARSGSIKAFLLTRFTDIGLYAGIFLVIISQNNFYIPVTEGQTIPLAASLWLLLAVMGKSAQVPFQSWLSAAMAGPTPVSALLHSATMVGAGALLLIKLLPLFSTEALFWIAVVGSITILLTGLTAIFSKDVKQMLAASTSSQLGFMLLAVGTGFPGAALAHWLAHAFMKSSLFLGAGIFQEGYESTLYEKIKGSGKNFKAAFFGFAIAGIGLAGIPPMIGYWSKDSVLAASFKDGNIFFLITALTGAFFTAIYIGKALNRLWIGNAEKETIPKKSLMLAGIALLILFILGGGFFLEHLVKISGFEVPKDKLSKILGLLFAASGLLLGWFFRNSWFPAEASDFIRKNYPVAGGYQSLVIAPILKLADFTYKIDKLILSAIEKTGETTLTNSKASFSTDRLLKSGVRSIGSFTLFFSKLSEKMDRGIMKSVENLAAAVKSGGSTSKKWQSGMVHKELAISVAGLLVLVVILIFTITEL